MRSPQWKKGGRSAGSALTTSAFSWGTVSFLASKPLEAAGRIAGAVRPPSKVSALFLTSDISLIEEWALKLQPAIVQLGRSARATQRAARHNAETKATRHAPNAKHSGRG